MKKLAIAYACLVAASCGGQPASRGHGSGQGSRGVVMLAGQPETASIWVDGRYVGVLATLARGLALRPGWHQIEVRAEGYYTAFRDVEVVAGRSTYHRVDLHAWLP